MRSKRNRKLMSILLTLSLLVTLLVPMVGPASAAGTIQALSCPTVTDADEQQLGDIKVTVTAGSIKANDSIIFKIPDGWDFGEAFSTVTNNDSVVNGVYVPATIDADGHANGLLAANIAVNILDANDEVQLTANANQSLTNDFIFYIHMRNVDVEDGETDDCVVTFSGPAQTGFPKGTVTIAKVSSSGSVTLSAGGTDTSNNDFTFDLRIEEDVLGSLEVETDSLKLKLPAGYRWTTRVENQVVNAIWGNNIQIDITPDDEELTIGFDGRQGANGSATDTASCWEIPLAFTVDDDSKVKAGDVVAKISGKTSSKTSELVVGTYGEYGATVSVKDVPTVIAGKVEQEIGDIVIKEDMGHTLIQNRTVTLTLPAGARWQPAYAAETDDVAATEPNDGSHDLDNFTRDEGLQLDFDSYSGTDFRTAKFVVRNESGDAAEVKLEDIEVALEAGFEGDLEIEVGGTAGVTGKIVVAKVVNSVTAKAESAPNVVIGLSGQAGGDFTITENEKEAFIDGRVVILDLPAGVVFTQTPTVEVVEGDLKITNIQRGNNDNDVRFTVDNESTTPSTIKVSGVKLKLDRTVAEGDITLKVQGGGVIETTGYADWANSDTAAKCVIAKVVTPAPVDTKYTSVFKIGDTKYTVNGVEMTMDVAPYIKDSRTYMPIRFAAQAAGVADSNIMWNPADQSVVLIKGDRVVKLNIGSTTMYINGVAFTMDVAPELVDPGRTMLPIRWVAQALGCEVLWDEATQSVTVK